jgi:hypothetical protein
VQLIYYGRDITGSVELNKVTITDNAGGISDSAELVFSDTEGLWSRWNPQKGETFEVKNDGFSSGLLYVDALEQQRGKFLLKGLSIPQNAKTAQTKSWEEIRFLSLAGEIAGKYGYKLKTYGVQNWLYSRVDQIEQTDFEFLAYRCMLEGYILKINGGKMIIYDIDYLKMQAAQKVVYRDELLGEYFFKSSATGLYHSCVVRGNALQAEYTPNNAPAGPTLKKNLPAGNLAEARRWARGLLIYANQSENVGSIQVHLDAGIAAGSMLEISGVGMADGKYFVDQAIQKLTEERTLLRLRKPLEGYIRHGKAPYRV